jgi:hypothetical protein
VIQFPKLHIAESVLNRISNTLEERGPLGLASRKPAAPVMQEQPVVPNPDVIGNAINNKIKEPMQAVAVAPEKEADANSGMLEASVMGGSPFDGALIGAGS